MTLPTTYTEGTLATYMHTTLGAVATSLGFIDPASYTEAVYEAIFAYGVDSIASITGRDNLRRLRGLARVQVWQLVANVTAGDFDFKADDASFSRSQVHKMALENIAQAKAEALNSDPNYQVGVGAISWTNDPYAYRDDDV